MRITLPLRLPAGCFHLQRVRRVDVYLKISVENFITIGMMLLAWMLALHLAGQFGIGIASWLPGSGSGSGS